MDSWLGQLQAELDHLKTDHRLRQLQPVEPIGHEIYRDGKRLINLASNDYLALIRHRHLQTAAIEAIRTFGTGAGASRLVSGHLPIHSETESRFAKFKHAEAALIFPTGYMANLAVLATLAGKNDLICVDKLNHASLLDAARASGAKVRVFAHRHTNKLARVLDRHANSSVVGHHRPHRRLIVTDSIFSMDGDCAHLPSLCDLADRYDAILVVDEAHGSGVLGDTGAGLCELQGVSQRVDIVVSTASKAMASLGGIVTARREVIDTLVNRARSFIYTTAVPPAQAAVIGAALDVIRDEPWRRRQVLNLSTKLRRALEDMQLASGCLDDTVTPIVPIVVGTSRAALNLADHLERHGLFAPAIRPPTVGRGAARVRISLRADLESRDLDRLCAALACWRPEDQSPSQA